MNTKKIILAITGYLCTALQASPNLPCSLKETQGFIRAIHQNDDAAVLEAIAAGFDVNSTPENILSPLMFAIMHNRHNMATHLIAAGADIQANRRGVTPLTIAAGFRNIIALQELLSRGVCAGSDSSSASQALIIAIRHPSCRDMVTTVVKKLLAAGASLDVTDKNDQTALDVAAQQGCFELVQLLEQHGAIFGSNLRRKKLIKQLYDAVETGNLLAAQEAIEAGAPVNASYRGNTLLNLAIMHFQQPLIQLFIDSGANVNTDESIFFPYAEGCPPLVLAVQQGNVAAVTLLLQCGADANYRCLDNSTPAMHALSIYRHRSKMSADSEILQLLISANANLNLSNFMGHTPLTLAAYDRELAFVQLFIPYCSTPQTKTELQALNLGSSTEYFITYNSDLAKQDALQIEAMLTETNSTLPKPVAQLIRSFVTAATPSPEQTLADVDFNSYTNQIWLLIQQCIR